MKTLITADLHLDNSEKNSYRWDIFEWLRDTIEEHNIDRLVILGDLTERKDNHPSSLINRMTKELLDLSKICQVTILMGNHDYKEKTNPFFEFLGKFQNIKFISKVTQTGKNELFLPHTTIPQKDWKDIDFTKFKTIFLHQTLSGVETDSGHILKNDVTLPKNIKATVISGDIHKPQGIYVGAPHAVDFGDIHDGRVFLLENNKLAEISYPGVKKWHLEIESPEEIKNYDMREGDQCRVTLWMTKEKYYLNDEYKKEIRNNCEHVRFSGTKTKIINTDEPLTTKTKQKTVKESPKKVFKRFTKTNNITKEYKNIGEDILNALS